MPREEGRFFQIFENIFVIATVTTPQVMKIILIVSSVFFGTPFQKVETLNH